MLTLLLVPIIMVCAIGGTMGILRVIKKFAPDQLLKGNPKQQETASAR